MKNSKVQFRLEMLMWFAAALSAAYMTQTPLAAAPGTVAVFLAVWFRDMRNTSVMMQELNHFGDVALKIVDEQIEENSKLRIRLANMAGIRADSEENTRTQG